jgi:hypothetical protein
VRLAAVALAAILASACEHVPPLVGCPASRPETIGDWWVEVGGPNAHFNIEPGTLRPGADPWLVIVRIQPDPGDPSNISAWVEPLDNGVRADVTVNSRMNPATVFRGASRAPQLPGGWFLLEVPIETSGCWRIDAAVDGTSVGSAVLEVPGT